jgi:hypothetical protein
VTAPEKNIEQSNKAKVSEYQTKMSDDNSSTETVTPRNADDPDMPDLYITIQKRPRYSVELDGTMHYLHNTNAVVKFMKEHDRPISIGDSFKSINIKPHSRYKLHERLNGAIIRRIARS